MINKQPVKITELALGGANQSLLASRLRIDDILPVAKKMDDVGYWSVESCSREIFKSCLQYLGENPWDRVRELKKAMPKTNQLMVLQGQNLLGWHYYADDIVENFIECAVTNGIDVFRLFDAMNDSRNLEVAIAATKKQGAHAQGTIIYDDVACLNNPDSFLSLAKKIEDMGADSIVINDNAGLLDPYEAFTFVKALKKSLSIPVGLHVNAAAGLSSMTLLKAIEAGADHVDTAISPMSMAHSFSPTESIAQALKNTQQAPEVNTLLLEDISAYFCSLRKKYKHFDQHLNGVNTAVLNNSLSKDVLIEVEKQLDDQGASHRCDDVMNEVVLVQEDLGSIPLVAQNVSIVVSQAVHNVLMGERYKFISKETQNVLQGEYGAVPSVCDKVLQDRVLNGTNPVTCRPSSLLKPEMEGFTERLHTQMKQKSLSLSDNQSEDVLTMALFPKLSLTFFEHRNDVDAFEPAPLNIDPIKSGASAYSLNLNGKDYTASVTEDGEVIVDDNGREYKVKVAIDGELHTAAPTLNTDASSGETVNAPLAGNIVKVCVAPGQTVVEGDTLLVLEAMKMETEVKASGNATIIRIDVKEGDSVSVGTPLITI
jgi:oxaloacetate decarboxylase alpha subunit